SPKKNYKNTRIGWVFESLNSSDSLSEDTSVHLNTTVIHYRTVENLATTHTEPIIFSIPIIRKSSDITFTAETTDQKVEVLESVEFMLEDIEPSESTGRYSPSQLLTYLECPTKYYLRYQLGLPEDARLPYFNEADIQAENVQGSLFGQIIHAVLEK